MFLCFFFFKQKTAYEMRISDWSSDVCSSDLVVHHGQVQAGHAVGGEVDGVAAVFELIAEVGGDVLVVFDDEDAHGFGYMLSRGSDRGGVLLCVSSACSLPRSPAPTVMPCFLHLSYPFFFSPFLSTRLFSPLLFLIF